MKKQILINNNLYNKRNVFLFEKLLKNMNITSSSLLNEITLKSLKQIIQAAETSDVPIAKILKADAQAWDAIKSISDDVARDNFGVEDVGKVNSVFREIANVLDNTAKYRGARVTEL